MDKNGKTPYPVIRIRRFFRKRVIHTEYIAFYRSPLGRVTLAGDGEALTGLWFEGQRHYAATLGAAHEARELPVFTQAALWLDRYFSGAEPDFLPPLHPKGTAFQRAVWALLLTIPYGQVVSYGALAAQLARQAGAARVSARAVGAAVGRNPVSLLIPCHRVVGADGSLTGYAGGLERKEALLRLEGLSVQGGRVRLCPGSDQNRKA